VSGGSAQTQLGGAQKHVASCYAGFGACICPIQATKNMHNMSLKWLCNHPSFFEKEMDLIIHRQEKQEAANTFVLPAAVTQCAHIMLRGLRSATTY
jgi:hypothetical protein